MLSIYALTAARPTGKLVFAQLFVSPGGVYTRGSGGRSREGEKERQSRNGGSAKGSLCDRIMCVAVEKSILYTGVVYINFDCVRG